MSWIVVIWSMVASACLTLAAMHLLVWCMSRTAWASLAFAFAALGVAGTAAGELLMMRSATPAEYAVAIRFTQVPVAVLGIALVGFLQSSFGNGRRWLGWAAVGLHGFALILNFTSGSNIVYRDIAALGQIEFLGEPVSVVAKAVANPWVRVDELGNLFLLLFVGDASVRLWRRGAPEERRQALRIGGSIFGFILLAAGYSALVDNQVIQSPCFISLPFLGLVTVMGLELSRDVLRSNQLVRELQDSQANLLASRAELAERLRFEELLAELSAKFIGIPADGIDLEINTALQGVCKCLELDIGVLWQWEPGRPETFVLTHYFRPFDGPAVPEQMDASVYFPWSLRQMQQGKMYAIPSTENVPEGAAVDQQSWRHFNIKSVVAIPLAVGGAPPFGVLSFNTARVEQTWPALLVRQFESVARVFASALVRKRDEQSLLESEARLNLAAESAGVGLWSLDLGSDVFWITPKIREFYGFAATEVVTWQRLMEAVHPEDRKQVEHRLREVVRTGKEERVEFRVLQPDGRVRWLSSRGRLRDDMPGAARSVMGVTVDDTERKLAELETRELRRDLAHASRVTLLGQLASALAHELGQPLGAIVRNTEAAELILQEDPPDLEELRAIVTDIRQDDQRAGAVINRLRSLLKRRELELHSVGLSGVIAEVAALVRGDAKERGVRIEVSTAPNLPDVLGDRVHLQQVLLNLLINTMDALMESRAGERGITIDATSAPNGQVMVSVSDNGPGIPEARLGRLFEPFFTTKSKGMGVGLAMSKHLIEAHQGKLWVENRPEGGAVFRFTLPMAMDGGAA